MNREAKIGMLTGLAVILFVGVLLSNYFEHNNADRAAPMADVKESFRHNALATVGVPGVDGGISVGPTLAGAGGQMGTMRTMAAFAAGTGDKTDNEKPTELSTAVTVGEAVKAEAVGNIPTPGNNGLDGGLGNKLAGGNLASNGTGLQTALYVPNDPTKVQTGSSKPVEPAGTVYIIAKNDNLKLIAKRNYRSATNADVARIIAANPKELKDDVKSLLIVGHKLIIPPLPVVAKTELKPVGVTKTVTNTGTISIPVVPMPGAGTKEADKVVKVEKTETVKVVTYKVQKGDTLEKLAGKLLGSKSNEAQMKIATMNNLKAPYALQVDQMIKVPAKAVSEPKKNGAKK